jgi:short-subunit dehydrogenase
MSVRPRLAVRNRMILDRPLAGKVIAITGAGRGIGNAIATTLAAAGANVVLGDLDVPLVQAAAERIATQAGGAAIGLPLDVTDSASFAGFLTEIEHRYGTLDVLVNNAGIMWVGPFDDEPDATMQRQFGVNVFGVMRGMKLAIPAMRARGAGHVVTIASAASKLAPPGEATYAATKHAVYGYATAVREELRGTGVLISLILPGVVDTELAIGTATGPTARLTPQHVADAVLSVALKPRFEVFVPARVGLVPRLAALLPVTLRDLLFRAVVPDQLRALTDPAVRAGYEQRTDTGADGSR